MNFSEVHRAQLAKSTLLISMLVPLGSFRSFKVCSNTKERVGCGKQWEAIAPIQSLVKLQPLFLRFAMEDLHLAELQPRLLHLQWRTCPWAEHSDNDDHEVKNKYGIHNNKVCPLYQDLPHDVGLHFYTLLNKKLFILFFNLMILYQPLMCQGLTQFHRLKLP